jgi:hypothetical protein
MSKVQGLLCVLLAAAAVSAGAADSGTVIVMSEPDVKVNRTMDWRAGSIVMEVTHALDPSIPSLVRAKQDAETDIEARLPDFLARAVAPLQVDSSRTLGDLLGTDPALFARFSALDLGARRDQLFLSQDFSSLVARYTLPLFGERGISTPLLPTQATPLHRRLGYVPTRKFTGLLIYATGLLPEAGTGRMTAARPALFPRIWDEQMNLVLEKGMCSPDALARWGMVGYALSPDEDAATLRVGAFPLRLAARGVFGDVPADIVIPTDGARQLLTLAENMDLLRQGRIAIVYDTLP